MTKVSGQTGTSSPAVAYASKSLRASATYDSRACHTNLTGALAHRPACCSISYIQRTYSCCPRQYYLPRCSPSWCRERRKVAWCACPASSCTPPVGPPTSGRRGSVVVCRYNACQKEHKERTRELLGFHYLLFLVASGCKFPKVHSQPKKKMLF